MVTVDESIRLKNSGVKASCQKRLTILYTILITSAFITLMVLSILHTNADIDHSAGIYTNTNQVVLDSAILVSNYNTSNATFRVFVYLCGISLCVVITKSIQLNICN
jgi:hypothetical protein